MSTKADTIFHKTVSTDVIEKRESFTFRDMDFNIAFGLQPNNFTITNFDMSDYVNLNAVIHENEYVNG